MLQTLLVTINSTIKSTIQFSCTFPLYNEWNVSAINIDTLNKKKLINEKERDRCKTQVNYYIMQRTKFRDHLIIFSWIETKWERSFLILINNVWISERLEHDASSRFALCCLGSFLPVTLRMHRLINFHRGNRSTNENRMVVNVTHNAVSIIQFGSLSCLIYLLRINSLA